MKWLSLYNKLAKQHISITRKSDVIVIINNKEIKIIGIKFKVDGSPYLIIEPNNI